MNNDFIDTLNKILSTAHHSYRYNYFDLDSLYVPRTVIRSQICFEENFNIYNVKYSDRWKTFQGNLNMTYAN